MTKNELPVPATGSGSTVGGHAGHATVEDALAKLNEELLDRAEKAGVSVGPISIPGVEGGDDEKIAAIQNQFNGIVERIIIPAEKLPPPKP